ncbi:MAG TPA: hypothetical protein VJ201_00010 [Candidatus Babeliales bacterium]|nr:hypothetical protein [Candidatus Babeliales bacterium]
MMHTILLLLSILFLFDNFTNTMDSRLYFQQKYHAGAAGAAFIDRARPQLPNSDDDKGYKSLDESDEESKASPYQEMTLEQLSQSFNRSVASFDRIRTDARANYHEMSLSEDIKKLTTKEDYSEAYVSGDPIDQLSRLSKQKAIRSKDEFHTLKLITMQALKLHSRQKENLHQQNQTFKNLFIQLLERFETLKEMFHSDAKTSREINRSKNQIEDTVARYWPEV